MIEKQAKKQLRKLLKRFPPGTLLHFVAEIFGEFAEEAQRDNDALAVEQAKTVEHTLIVVGMGVAAAYPRD